uniref:Protein LLP homolog n=1 Tax=Glossina brevipalpis TaxID=37001 RepID=A0A1A9WG02_9MUSC
MGRTNRSRKRRDKMNLIKKARYEAKELIRLKRTLGIMETDEGTGDHNTMESLKEIATVKTGKELKKERRTKEEEELRYEMEEAREKGQNVTIVNEKTGKTHIYNTKTLKDQHGSYPPWFKPKKTAKRMRKKAHAQKKNFKQAWTVTNVPL